MNETSIRWEIVEEHLDEAAFLFQRWEEALRSPDYTLAEIAEGPEERLLAHLDGLVLGGSHVARKLLLPALASDERGAVFAAAFALLASEDGDFTDEVLRALEKGEPDQRTAIRRAMGVVPVPALGPRLAALAPSAPAIQADLLEVLGYLRVDPGLHLEPLANSGDPALEALAIRLAQVFPDKLDPVAVERAYASTEEEVCFAALETGLVLGVRGAFAACESAVKERGPAFGRAALLLGLSGDEKSAAALVPALGEPEVAREAAFALGFTGRVSAADALLAAMADEDLAAVAAEGFSAITGLAVEKRFAKPPRRWNPEEDEEEEEEYGPETDLPKPEPEAIAKCWKGVRPKLDAGKRWMRGNVWSPEALLRELEQGPARRREALGVELSIRSRGEVLLGWDGLSTRQSAELSVARMARVHGGGFLAAAVSRHPHVAGSRPAATPRNTPAGARARHSLAVTAVGLASSLGASAPHACAAARARLSRPARLDLRTFDPDDGSASAAVGHVVPGLAGFDGLGRIAALAALALRDLVERGRGELSPRTGIFVAAPSGWYFTAADRLREKGIPPDDEPESAQADTEEQAGEDASPVEPGRWERLAPRLARELVPRAFQLARLPAPAAARIFPLDSPGFVAALDAARAALDSGELDRCVVGGVDTLVTIDHLEALDLLGLLKCPESPTGLSPGEAGAFVLVERADAARRRGAVPLCHLGPSAATKEPGDPLERPPSGRALEAALREVLAGNPDARRWRGLVIADHNGTSHRAQDWGNAQARLRRGGFSSAAELYPAASFGEVGAATGGVAVALAAAAFTRGWSPDASALAWLSADGGGRAALLVTAPDEARGRS